MILITYCIYWQQKHWNCCWKVKSWYNWPERRHSRRTVSTAHRSAAYSDSSTRTSQNSLSGGDREDSRFVWKIWINDMIKTSRSSQHKYLISPSSENKLPRPQEPPGILPGPEGRPWIHRKVKSRHINVSVSWCVQCVEVHVRLT